MSEIESPRIPLRLTVVEVLASVLAVRLVVEPSTSVAVGLVALAGAWALERVWVTDARLRQASVTAAEAAARRAEESASTLLASLSALESRLVRLETREGWRSDGATRR